MKRVGGTDFGKVANGKAASFVCTLKYEEVSSGSQLLGLRERDDSPTKGAVAGGSSSSSPFLSILVSPSPSSPSLARSRLVLRPLFLPPSLDSAPNSLWGVSGSLLRALERRDLVLDPRKD